MLVRSTVDHVPKDIDVAVDQSEAVIRQEVPQTVPSPFE